MKGEIKLRSEYSKFNSIQRLDKTIANDTFAGSDSHDDMNDEVSGSLPTSSSPMTSQQPVELRVRHTSLTSYHNKSTTPKNVTARYHSHLFNSNNNDDLSSPAMASHSSTGRPTTTTTYLVSTSPNNFYWDIVKTPNSCLTFLQFTYYIVIRKSLALHGGLVLDSSHFLLIGYQKKIVHFLSVQK